jgi:hypothetical protein
MKRHDPAFLPILPRAPGAHRGHRLQKARIAAERSEGVRTNNPPRVRREHRPEKRRRDGPRHNPTSEEAVRALNLIDVVFHDAPRVRELWHEYFAVLNTEGLGGGQRQKKNLEMITEMAKVLGYGEAITHLDMDRVYYPVALGEQARKSAALVDGFLRLFEKLGAGERKPPEG